MLSLALCLSLTNATLTLSKYLSLPRVVNIFECLKLQHFDFKLCEGDESGKCGADIVVVGSLRA
jgi:hypothetical protein